jgi:very-short-patch-repair endonuclease
MPSRISRAAGPSLVVELDGGQHSDSEDDAKRTEMIEARGYRVIRYWNHDVMENLDGVLVEISRELALARGD